MKKLIIGVVVVLVIVFGIMFFAGRQSSEQAETELGEEEQIFEPTGEVKEFTVAGGNFYFSTEEIRVNAGDLVRITFFSEDGFHDFVIDEFNVASEAIREDDGSVTVEFVANKKGEFEYYCSVGQHRALGQVGTLIVE